MKLLATTTLRSFSMSLGLALTLAACGGKAKPVEPVAEPAPVEPAPTEPTETAPTETTPNEPVAEAKPAPDPKLALLDAEKATYEAAKPVFEKACALCHTQAGAKKSAKKLAEFDMTSYPFTGKYAGDIAATMKKVLGVGGGKATMPANKPGSVKDGDLELIVAWANAWQAAQDGGAH
ncbi:MAG: c-type cytochrome [Kofleriaceae bacterium]|jgi:mono/diheme cytochrome c family protein|nr:c-type cytochrome [Kofleriaceae bacterium]